MALLSIPFGWQALTRLQAALLVIAGFCGGFGADTDDGILPPRRSLDGGAVRIHLDDPRHRGRLFRLRRRADHPHLVGGAIVIGAGIFIIWREHRLGIERAAASTAMTPPQ